MAAETIELVIVTPERQLLRDSVAEIELPGASGYLGVLPGHAPLITELGVGVLTYRRVSGGEEAEPIAVIQGFAEVLGERVTVLAETAERPAEIDLARAEAALKRAQERIASSRPEVDLDRANIALQRALVRVRVAEYAFKRRRPPAPPA